MRIKFRPERFAVDKNVGIDSEIFVTTEISEFDDPGTIQKEGKTLFFEVGRFALLFVPAPQFGSVDSLQADGDVLSGDG